MPRMIVFLCTHQVFIVSQIHNFISLIDYSAKASICLCWDCACPWKRVGLVWHLHFRVSFLICKSLIWFRAKLLINHLDLPLTVLGFSVICLFGAYLLVGTVYRYFILGIHGIDVSFFCPVELHLVKHYVHDFVCHSMCLLSSSVHFSNIWYGFLTSMEEFSQAPCIERSNICHHKHDDM